METEYDSSRIERAKRGLYRSTDDEETQKQHYAELSPSKVDVGNDWEDTSILTTQMRRKMIGVKFLKSVVVLAVLAMVGSGGYLLYQILGLGSQASAKNIIISFDVPVGVTPGVPADILVRISNQNRVGLEYGNLTLVYPSGTRKGDNPDKDLRDEKRPLGAIAAGQTVEYRTKAIFLGEENTDKELHSSLEFRFENINSIFTKEEVRPVHLLAAPINLSVDALKEVNAGQEIELTVNALSNTVMRLRDVLIKVEYPLGFTYAEAEPKPTFGNNIWRVGTMDPTGKFRVKVRGVLAGEDTQEKVFHTSVGVGSDQTERNINVLYSNVISSMMLQRPFIGIRLFLNGKAAGLSTAHYGERITGEVRWVNNLSTKIVNAQIEVRLSGVALNRETVSSHSGGFYRSADDTVLWDERTNQALAVIEAGVSGEVDFSFLPLPPVAGTQLITSPNICAEVTVRGKRISESGVPEEVKTVMTECTKVTSQVQFAARAVFYDGPFINTGPLPPRVEQETTYTVIWNIMNTSNTVTNTQAQAIIPSYVSWAGAVYPNKENITYNPTTHMITWSPGDIPAGTGIGGKPPREVAFQLILMPSLTQMKTSPVILENIRFEGKDSYTGETLTQVKNDLTTILSTDRKATKELYFVAP